MKIKFGCYTNEIFLIMSCGIINQAFNTCRGEPLNQEKAQTRQITPKTSLTAGYGSGESLQPRFQSH